MAHVWSRLSAQHLLINYLKQVVGYHPSTCLGSGPSASVRTECLNQCPPLPPLNLHPFDSSVLFFLLRSEFLKPRSLSLIFHLSNLREL